MRYSDGNFERIFLKPLILKTLADDKKACKISKQACRGNCIIYFYVVFLIRIFILYLFTMQTIYIDQTKYYLTSVSHISLALV